MINGLKTLKYETLPKMEYQTYVLDEISTDIYSVKQDSKRRVS